MENVTDQAVILEKNRLAELLYWAAESEMVCEKLGFDPEQLTYDQLNAVWAEVQPVYETADWESNFPDWPIMMALCGVLPEADQEAEVEEAYEASEAPEFLRGGWLAYRGYAPNDRNQHLIVAFKDARLLYDAFC